MNQRHVHCIGICGYAVSGAALLAKELGYIVTGSDEQAYPPISTLVTAAGILWAPEHTPENLTRWGKPDLVIVGNHIRATNTELCAAKELGIPFTSEIEFFVDAIGERVRVAICGTHGKTTTTSLVAHILGKAGMDPGFRIGGIALDFGKGTTLGTGPFVFEGDEYTTAPWDNRPKFFHISPTIATLVALEWDHPDVYPTVDAYFAPFIAMIEKIPSTGILICGGDAVARALAGHATCTVITYGTNEDADWRLVDMNATSTGQAWNIVRQGAPPLPMTLPRPGTHDAFNATAAAITAHVLGVADTELQTACATFHGPQRRYEQLTPPDADRVVIDDYAHHPTEVRVVVDAARRQFPDRRIIAVHTPHTYSRTLAMLSDYRECFRSADVVILGPIDAARERGMPATVASAEVASQIPPPTKVALATDANDAVRQIEADAQAGDVVVIVSLSGFDKIAERLALHSKVAPS